jgi:hypothetical protein
VSGLIRLVAHELAVLDEHTVGGGREACVLQQQGDVPYIVVHLEGRQVRGNCGRVYRARTCRTAR